MAPTSIARRVSTITLWILAAQAILVIADMPPFFNNRHSTSPNYLRALPWISVYLGWHLGPYAAMARLSARHGEREMVAFGALAGTLLICLPVARALIEGARSADGDGLATIMYAGTIWVPVIQWIAVGAVALIALTTSADRSEG